MTGPPGLADVTYRRYCRLLAIAPITTHAPMARSAHLPPWMCEALIATPAAAAKLQAWVATTPPPWATVAEPTDVLMRALFIGDPILAQLAARLIAERLPPPVRDYVIARVCFLGIGCTVAGLYSGPTPADRALVTLSFNGRLRGGAAADHFADVTAHEISHAWLLDEATEAVTSSAFRDETLLHAASMPAAVADRVRALRAQYAQYEREAHALAVTAWGFGDPTAAADEDPS